MKQIEITVKVNCDLNKAIDILEKQGFKIIRRSVIDDIYMTQDLKNLNISNIQETLTGSILLRYLNENGNVFKKITYKNKVYDNGIVISEEKINLDCSDLEKAEKLFLALKFDRLTRVKYDVVVLEKDGLEFCFQDVDGLGLLLEYEHLDDFEGKSNEEILQAKYAMRDELSKYMLDVDEDIDIKKAYELIKKNI